MNKASKWFAVFLVCICLSISSPALAQDNNDKESKEKNDKNDNDDNSGREEGFNDWGLLGLLGLLGLAGLRKSGDKHIPVDRRPNVPRSDSPVS